MKKIILKLYDFELAEIVDNEELLVLDNKENIEKARKMYPLNMREYRKGLSGYVYPIENYFNALNRNDIILEAKINESDRVFEKLYKVAGLNIQPINGFSISRG